MILFPDTPEAAVTTAEDTPVEDTPGAAVVRQTDGLTDKIRFGRRLHWTNNLWIAVQW